MDLSNEKINELSKRLLLSRMRILTKYGFYGVLLMHMKFGLDAPCETACTDGEKIMFNPTFLDELTDSEVDFVLMHEILHAALRHCFRCANRDPELFNIACDIVVNSNILYSNDMDLNSISIKKYGISMHTVPDGDEGYKYTAEEVYKMLKKNSKNNKGAGWDNHSKWPDKAGNEDKNNELADAWEKMFSDACEAMEARAKNGGGKQAGSMPVGAEIELEKLRKPQVDWKTILNDFVQEDIVDYSFSPPDRRFADNPFFLPDFNEKDDVVDNILFMIDTSGSMTNKDITAVYSEVKGAIDQFNGKLRGWLGFFDAAVVEPKAFESEEEFKVIKPKGGGGTSFMAVFNYVKNHMQDRLPASIIMLTDGYAPFPMEECAMGIPVLWLLNNTEVQPPWGKVARIKV